MNWRDYDALPFVRTRYLDLALCRTWFIGWQYWREYSFPRYHLGLCLLPGIMLTVKWGHE